MPQNDYNQSRQEFEQFRAKLDQSFNYRRDTIMDLVDAIAANTEGAFASRTESFASIPQRI